MLVIGPYAQTLEFSPFGVRVREFVFCKATSWFILCDSLNQGIWILRKHSLQLVRVAQYTFHLWRSMTITENLNGQGRFLRGIELAFCWILRYLDGGQGRRLTHLFIHSPHISWTSTMCQLCTRHQEQNTRKTEKTLCPHGSSWGRHTINKMHKQNT